MRSMPRLAFWIGVISIFYGMILKILNYYGDGPVAFPFGLMPGAFLKFSALCFLGAIAFSVVYIFQKKEY